MGSSSHVIERAEATFDDDNLVANAGLALVGVLVLRLGLERLINDTVRLTGRVGGALPGRKLLTLVHSLMVGAPTSPMPMSCVPGRHRKCCRIG